MKILQLCKKFPYPAKDGETIAVNYLSKALNDLGCKVSLLAMNTKKHYFDISTIPAEYNHYKAIHAVDVDTEIKAWDAFSNLFSSDSYHIARFVSPAFEQALAKLLQENDYDIVQLETLYLAPYIPTIRKYSKAKVAMRAHNVEHEIWDRIAENTSFFPKRWYLNHLTQKLRQYEVAQLKHYDILVPITTRDEQIFRKLGFNNESVVTPIGLDSDDYVADNASYKKDLSISFIGSMDWMPNQEGLNWFLNNIWNKLQLKFPNLQLHIAGRNTPDWMYNMNLKNVKVHGEIPDAYSFINAHSIMLVPLLSGSGMRAKILEGMALGKVVITTSLGLEGIDAKHKEEVIIADSIEQFVEGIQYCYSSNGHLSEIGKQAQAFIVQKYNNIEIAKKLLATYKSGIVNALPKHVVVKK